MAKQRQLERVLLGLIGVLTVALMYVVYDSVQERMIVVGDSAPTFSVTTESGKRITRSDFGGKVLVLNFWATWCPPCVEELPSLNQFARDMAPSGVVVLGVSVDRNERLYKAFLKRNNVAFETARDPETNISAEYGTFKYPETYVIDLNGKVRQKHIGQVDWNDPTVIASIKALL